MHQIQILKKYGISVKGERGQHLLIDENIQKKIVEFVNPKRGERILEIGPGLGAITELLLERGAHVTAVEQDPQFVVILREELGKNYPDLKIIENDILKFPAGEHFPGKKPVRAVGNIPYYITSEILLYLIGHREIFESACLMVQKEIADRLLAQPGTKSYGRLTLLVRYYADLTRIFEVSRNCFSPRPEVDSTVVLIAFRKKTPKGVNEKVLFDVIKHGFGQRRKTVLNSIGGGFSNQIPKVEMEKIFADAGIAPNARAENLLLKDFIRLAELLEKKL